MSSEDAGRTACLKKERLAAKEIVRAMAIGMGMRHELRQHRNPTPDASSLVALQAVGTHAVQVTDGSLRAVLECPTLPVTPAHGERGWLTAMDRLLDQLDHPFQLVVQRRSLHCASHLVRKDAASRLRDSYERLLADRWPDRPARRRRLFVVVSSPAGDDERAQAEALERQVRTAGEALHEAGIETVRVPAMTLAARASAPYFEELRSEVRFGGQLARPLRVTECPSLMSSDWLAALRTTDADLDVSVHMRPPALASSGRRAVSAELLVTVWAADRARMDEASRALERTLAERLVRTRRAVFEAEPAVISTLPLGLAQAGTWRGFQVRTLTSLLSSSWSGDAAVDRGLLCGVEPGSGRPLLLDRTDLTGRAAVVLGAANAGQSSVLKVQAARARMAGAGVIAIDTHGDFASFVAALGGTVIRVDPRTPPPFDAFAVQAGHPGALSSRIACITAAIELLAGGLTDHQASALEHALSYAFALGGHTDDGDAAPLPAPFAADVVAALERQSTRAFGEVKSQIDTLARVLTAHVGGAGGRLFSEPAALHPRAPLMAYDLSEVPAEDRPAAALLTLDHVCAWGSGSEPRVVLLDEVTSVTGQPRAAGFLANLTKTAGTRGVGLWLATADVAALLQSPARGLVTESHLKVVLRQAPDDVPALAELLHLTPAEQSWLLAARLAEGLLVMPEQRLAFELVMTEEERRLITEGAKR